SIPNTAVKPSSAEGTWTAGSRENRTLPSEKKAGGLQPASGKTFNDCVEGLSSLCAKAREGAKKGASEIVPVPQLASITFSMRTSAPWPAGQSEAVKAAASLASLTEPAFVAG